MGPDVLRCVEPAVSAEGLARACAVPCHCRKQPFISPRPLCPCSQVGPSVAARALLTGMLVGLRDDENVRAVIDPAGQTAKYFLDLLQLVHHLPAAGQTVDEVRRPMFIGGEPAEEEIDGS